MISDRIVKATVDAATKAGLSASGLLALIECETAGAPYERDGRTPNFLFEKHVFGRELKARVPGKLAGAIRAGLALPRWQGKAQYADQRNFSQRMALIA